ncbi:MAG: helix-turn-helix transcriptional regulator [Clostridia bacterium]|nr:helix-turn-helix transcriptional regulator [Clostridia bacterium]
MIGENIKYFRTKMNLTQEELANKLNVTRQAISK